MKVSYTIDELNDWYIECQENAEILIYVGGSLTAISMSDEREAYIQLVLGVLVCIGLALYVSFSDWTLNFFPPPPIIPMGAG